MHDVSLANVERMSVPPERGGGEGGSSQKKAVDGTAKARQSATIDIRVDRD